MYHKDNHAVSSQDDDITQEEDNEKNHLRAAKAGQALDDEEGDAIVHPAAVNGTGSVTVGRGQR